jgi:hypothetical protein
MKQDVLSINIFDLDFRLKNNHAMMARSPSILGILRKSSLIKPSNGRLAINA